MMELRSLVPGVVFAFDDEMDGELGIVLAGKRVGAARTPTEAPGARRVFLVVLKQAATETVQRECTYYNIYIYL